MGLKDANTKEMNNYQLIRIETELAIKTHNNMLKYLINQKDYPKLNQLEVKK